MKTTEEERRAMRETTHPSYVDDLLDDLDAAEREREELARGVIRYAAEIVRLVPREQVVVIAMLLKKLVTPPATPSGTSAECKTSTLVTARRWPKRLTIVQTQSMGRVDCHVFREDDADLWPKAERRIYQLVPKAKRRKTKKNPPRP